MIASRADHGTAAAISARNTSRFVRFFLPAKSSDAKLSCPSIGATSESTASVCQLSEADQRFLRCQALGMSNCQTFGREYKINKCSGCVYFPGFARYAGGIGRTAFGIS